MKTLVVAVLTLLIVGCALPGNYNNRTIVAVKHSRIYEPVGAKEHKYEDKNIIITYTPDIVDAGNEFQFINKTNEVLKIIWDESLYLDPSGQSTRVFHAGVKIADRDQSQVPSIIPPKGALNDFIASNSNITFTAGDYGGWVYVPICGARNSFTHDLDDSQCLGKIFGYMITYESAGKKKNVTLKFKYVSKKPLAAQPKTAP